MSLTTQLLQTGFGLARLGTVFLESDDLAFQLQYVVGVVMNLVILWQFYVYNHRTNLGKTCDEHYAEVERKIAAGEMKRKTISEEEMNRR